MFAGISDLNDRINSGSNKQGSSKGESQKEVPSEKRPLLQNSQPQTPGASGISKDLLIQMAVKYLDWLEALAPAPGQQVQSSSPNISAGREVAVIRILRQVCPNIFLDRERTEIGWNETHGTAFLLVHFRGTFLQKYVR
jgi:hypothetical protein